MSANFADNSLHWLKGELNLTIGRVQASLENYLEDPDELGELREAVGHIDQLRGALTMMDLGDATALAEEMCFTARELCDETIDDPEAAGDGLMRAALWFPGYLEALERGQTARVPDLDLITRDLRAVRNGSQAASGGAERVSIETLNTRLVKEIRPGFQRSLIALMHREQVDQTLVYLAETLTTLQGLAESEHGYRVWWFASLLIEALRRDSLTLGPDQLRLLGAVDRSIKALVDDGLLFVENPEVAAIPERVESMLAETAAADLLTNGPAYTPPAAGSNLAQVPGLDQETLGQIAMLLRETLALAQDGIDRLARGDETGGAQLPGIVERLEAAFGVLTMVNLNELAEMVREQRDALDACSGQETPLTGSQLDKLARKLVLIEDGLDVVAQPLTAQQVISDARRDDSDENSAGPAGAEGSRQALARFEVVREALSDIATIREIATKCCWNESGAESWASLSPLLHGLSNILTVLELAPGAETVRRVERAVANPVLSALAEGDTPATNALAEALVGIEYYIEGETSVGHPHEQGLEHATTRLERLEALLSDGDERAAQADGTVSGLEVENGVEIAERTDVDASAGCPEAGPDGADTTEEVQSHDDESTVIDPICDDGEPGILGLDEASPEPGFQEVGTEDALLDEVVDARGEMPASEGDGEDSSELIRSPFEHLPDNDDHSESLSSEESASEADGEIVAGDREFASGVGEPADEWESPPESDAVEHIKPIVTEIEGLDSEESDVEDEIQPVAAEIEGLDSEEPEVEREIRPVAAEFDGLDSEESDVEGEIRPVAAEFDGLDSEESDVEDEIRPVAAEFEGHDSAVDSAPEGGDASVESESAAPAWLSHEFLDVFLEEAAGEVEVLRQAVPVWEQDPTDLEPLKTIRRSFHTLKGSGRMVGAEKAGELGWSLENALNRVLDGRLAATPALIELTRDATGLVAELVEQMESGQEVVDIGSLVARAEFLVEGGEATPAASNEAGSGEPARDEELDTGDDLCSRPETASIANEPKTADVESSAPEDAETVIESGNVSASAEDEFRETALSLLGEIEILLGACRDSAGSVDALESIAHSFESFARHAEDAGIPDLAELGEAVSLYLRGQVYDARPLGTSSLETVSDAVAECYRNLDGLRGSSAYVSRAPEVLRRIRSLVEREAEDVSLGTAESAAAPSEVDADLDPELVEIFVQEAGDILDSTDVTLDRWGREPSNFDLLTDLRREMHTLKGSSRMAGFMVIGDLAHAMESLLDQISRGARTLTPNGRSLFQRSLDRLYTMLESSRVLQQPDAADDLVAALQRCAAGEEPEPEDHESASQAADLPTESPESAAVAPVVPTAESDSTRTASGDAVMLVADSADMVRVSSELLDRLGDQMGESSIYRARIDQGVSALAFNLGEMDQTVSRLSEKLRRLEIETEAQILFRYERGGVSEFEEEFDPLELDRFSELQQLSRSLMEVVNDLGSIHGSLDDQTQELETLLQEQAKVNREVQEGLMRTRMVRFDSIVPRMRRVVRQAAGELEKQAELVLEGGGEMERSLLDHVVGPLEHLLRNSVSHGIELPDLRAEAGKPAVGVIRLGERREGSELVIEVSDDGAGIDFEKVREKAERLGMLSPGKDATRDDLISCLLQSGFSTADKLTQVAGRGVGMDVVRDAVTGFGGSLTIESEPGRGTRILIRMPFSLSLAQALLVRASGETYAVPLAGIEAMTRLDPETMQNYLEQGRGSVEYGGSQYEIRCLGALFGNAPPDSEGLEHHLPAVLVKTEDVRVALQVDQVVGSQEVIVKPVGTQVSSVPGISGATITADGRVVLILELGALVRNFVARSADAEALALHGSRQDAEESELRIMVVDDSITMRKVTSRLVERHGMRATVAKDGLDASGLLEDEVPDAVILDIEMPRMDGFELAAHIRNQEHLWHLPIVMVTSRSGDKHRQRAMDLGVNAYLGKPYREEELLSAIRQVLGPRGERIAI